MLEAGQAEVTAGLGRTSVEGWTGVGTRSVFGLLLGRGLLIGVEGQ